MLDKMDMSLEDIIKQTKTPRQGGGRRPGNPNRRNQGGQTRGGGGGNKGPGIRRGGPQTGRIQKRGGPKFSRGDVNKTWTHDLFDGPRNRGGLGTTKLLISNLDFGVSESDVKELFSEFGNLKNHSIHYDRTGRSLGTADIIYERRADALKAMKTYNGVPLDGRPMNIQLATSDVPTPRSPTSRLGNRGPQRNSQNRGGQGGQQRRQGGPGQRGRGGANNGGGRQRRVAPTAEELDAELDEYAKNV